MCSSDLETSLPVTIFPSWLSGAAFAGLPETTHRAETSLPVTIFPSWLTGAAFAGLPETTLRAETSKPVTTFPVNSPDPCKL